MKLKCGNRKAARTKEELWNEWLNRTELNYEVMLCINSSSELELPPFFLEWNLISHKPRIIASGWIFNTSYIWICEYLCSLKHPQLVLVFNTCRNHCRWKPNALLICIWFSSVLLVVFYKSYTNSLDYLSSQCIQSLVYWIEDSKTCVQLTIRVKESAFYNKI